MYYLLLIFSLFHLSTCKLITQWTIINSNGSIELANVTSPIDVYSALFNTHRIEWPLKEFNDVNYRWIAYDDWVFISEPFSVENDAAVTLKISKLDISPIIYLNDHLLPTTNSEFITVYINLNSSQINYKKNNVLKLFFYSSVLLAKYKHLNSTYKPPPSCWPKEYNGECYINMIRKTQASFGWDWGPAIPTVGIRGEVEVISTTSITAKIDSVRVFTSSDSQCKQWSSNIVVDVTIIKHINATICTELNIPDLSFRLRYCQKKLQETMNFTFNLTHLFNKIKLWWPRGMGYQNLYETTVTVIVNNTIIAKTIKFIGFRNVELEDLLISIYDGCNYEFKVNCKTVYLKGTNYVPRTYLTHNWNDRRYIGYLLYSMYTSNINVIRIWGGGKPEIEEFYSVADNLGILIWHDLMFACALYPKASFFYETVHNEVSQIVKTVQYHPSIIAWAANNEIELAIASDWFDFPKQESIFNYNILFNKVIRDAVQKNDPYNPFILSSPTNGKQSIDEGTVAINPQDPLFGDVHFYVYDDSAWSAETYPITRMTTEFGFQSFPSVLTWDTIVGNRSSDYNIDDDFIHHREHQPDGIANLKTAIMNYFDDIWPINDVDDRENYKWFSYLTQIVQSEILRIHINLLRSAECLLEKDGTGLNRGMMYWQLNDNWVAPTWSTIDYAGRWKLAQYKIKTLYGSYRVILQKYSSEFQVYVVIPVDLNIGISYYVLLKMINIETGKIQYTKKLWVAKMKCNSILVGNFDYFNFLKISNCSKTANCIIYADLIGDKNKVLTSDSMLVDFPKDITLPLSNRISNITLIVKVNYPDFSTCLLTLTSSKLHLFVMLEANSLGYFSDNGFHFMPPTKVVIFKPWYTNETHFIDCNKIDFTVISLNKRMN